MNKSSQHYVGGRILEVMQSAPAYTDAVFEEAAKAMPPYAEKILDFGAGGGVFAEKFLSSGKSVDCVEPDERLRSSLSEIETTVFSDIDDVSSSSYDFIYSINVLEHIQDLDHACEQLLRILRPNGTLFIFVPAFEILWTSLDNEVGHLKRFTRASLTRALQDAGFYPERMKYFDSLGFPSAFAVRILQRLGLFRYEPSTV